MHFNFAVDQKKKSFFAGILISRFLGIDRETAKFHATKYSIVTLLAGKQFFYYTVKFEIFQTKKSEVLVDDGSKFSKSEKLNTLANSTFPALVIIKRS